MTRQKRQFIDALEAARRAAGRDESRCRLDGDEFGVRLAANERRTLAGMADVQRLRPTADKVAA
jgi:hypothetical protein